MEIIFKAAPCIFNQCASFIGRPLLLRNVNYASQVHI